MARSLTLRPAARDDAKAICAIYNQGIAGRQATFETRPREPSEVAAWFEDGLPLLVATDGAGQVVGWARVGAYSDRCVYEGVGEHAVYVDAAAQGRGVGRALLDALAIAAEAAGFHKLTSRVFTTNAASLAVHRAAGFSEVGVQLRHGRLDGTWMDCMLVERLLGAALVPRAAGDTAARADEGTRTLNPGSSEGQTGRDEPSSPH
jgi:L-amino acid N-acyltransferase YncA